MGIPALFRNVRINGMIIVASLLCLFVQPVKSATTTDRTITLSQWQKLTSDSAFNYRNDKEGVKKRDVEPYKESAWAKAVTKFFEFWKSDAGVAITWVLVITLVLIVIYKIFMAEGSMLFRKDKKQMGNAGATEITEDINSTDWDALLRQAMHSNDVRLAVRYCYMHLLQLLQRHELIQYKIDKTNYDYYSELSSSPYKQPFKQLSRQYEYTWYGNFTLPHTVFNEYLALFNDVKRKLGE